MILAATGHRPEKLGGYGPQVRYALGGLAVEALHELAPAKVISGMAQGWDQAVAASCVALRIPFIAAVPFKDQPDIWPPEARARWRWLLDQAAEVDIGNAPGESSVTKVLHARNRWMVDRADKVLALWDGTTGGTWNCVSYALKLGRPLVNLWPRWVMDAESRELVG